MSISSRIQGTIESWSQLWKDRLAGWMSSWVMKGLNSMIDEVEPGTSLSVESILQKIRDNPNTPDDIRGLINKITAPGHPLPLLVVIPIAIIFFVPMLFSVAQPLSRLLTYAEERVLHTFRPDPSFIGRIWLRDKPKWEWLWDDLRDLGFDDRRIEAAKELTQFLPGPLDLVNWEAKEVFEPDAITKYGLADEFELLDLSLFEKAGVTKEQARNYWIAHWEHASFSQVVEMLRRGLITDQDMYDWFRLVEVPPYWRDKLTEIAWEVPTRVDVRRFYDLKTIDEARLREIYTAMGYKGKNLEDYVLWTKIYVELPDLIARWKNGWITLDQAKSRLVELGMTAEAAEELVQTKVKVEQAEPVVEGKQLTKTEIYKAVNKELISVDEGIELLMDLDYSGPVAWLLLLSNVSALAGSPESFIEFKDLTQKYRLATGREGKPMTQELKQAARDVIRLTKERDDIQRAIDEMLAGVTEEDLLPEEPRKKLQEMRSSLYHAEAELTEARHYYNSQLALYHQGG